jgi:hypothetical protein
MLCQRVQASDPRIPVGRRSLALRLPFQHWLGCCRGLPRFAKGTVRCRVIPARSRSAFASRRCTRSRKVAVPATSPVAAPAGAGGPAQVEVAAQVLRAAVQRRAPEWAVVPGMQAQMRRAARVRRRARTQRAALVGAAARALQEARMAAQRAAPPAAGRTSSVFTRVAAVRSNRALLQMTAGSVRADGPSPRRAFDPAARGRDANRLRASRRHHFAQTCQLAAPAFRLAAACPGLSVNNPAGLTAENAGS